MTLKSNKLKTPFILPKLGVHTSLITLHGSRRNTSHRSRLRISDDKMKFKVKTKQPKPKKTNKQHRAIFFATCAFGGILLPVPHDIN